MDNDTTQIPEEKTTISDRIAEFIFDHPNGCIAAGTAICAVAYLATAYHLGKQKGAITMSNEYCKQLTKAVKELGDNTFRDNFTKAFNSAGKIKLVYLM